MKYLNPNMSGAEAKATYRQLSKQLHPDVGGDEEEFKILADEYTAIRSHQVLQDISLDDMLVAAGKRVMSIADTVADLYPRTSVLLNYSHDEIIAVYAGNTSFSRMREIERIILSFDKPYRFKVSSKFKRANRVAYISMMTIGDTTWINTYAGTPYDVAADPVSKGRRYTFYKGKKFEVCFDVKENHRYVMRRVRSLPLRELMGV